MAVLAGRFPAVEFVGLDLNEHIIRRDREDFRGVANLRWLAGDVFTTDYLEEERAGLVFTSGAAEYFTGEELERFIDRVKRAGTRAVFFNEPVTEIGFDYNRSEHSPRRGGMAFNHPYRRKLREAGATVEERISPDPQDPHVIDVLACGYFCDTNGLPIDNRFSR